MNLEKHGLDFGDLDTVFFDGSLVAPSYGTRWKAVGVHGEHAVIAVVFSFLGSEAVSVVSMRRASRSERRNHAENKG